MADSLFLAAENFEPVYGWLEDHADVPVEVWGLETARRAALLAYRGAPPDTFGWSNWASEVYEDPSEFCRHFETLELVLPGDVTALKAAFPGLLAATATPEARTAVPTI